MSRLRFACKIEKGKMSLLNRTEFDNAISKLQGEYYIELKETGVRSAQQNNYYWKVVVKVFGDELGYTREEMHEVLKNEFKIESTSKLDRDEFRDYLDKIIRWASIHFQILIPDPNQDED